jgi:hypothetical protein
MKGKIEPIDPAAVFACALSLWKGCEEEAGKNASLNLSDAYQGVDQLMREVMRIATLFETWACEHVEFEEITDVWPYLLENSFGKACLGLCDGCSLQHFDRTECLSVALGLGLPIRYAEELGLPLDIAVPNTVLGSPFAQFRIQTMRQCLGEREVEAFAFDDDPQDENYETPFLALYGVGADGILEHIKDFDRYADAVDLAAKLAPGIAFPATAIVQRQLASKA